MSHCETLKSFILLGIWGMALVIWLRMLAKEVWGRGGVGGTLGSESKEMALESQTWKSQMGLELVSLIHGLCPLVLPLVNFWARNVPPLFSSGSEFCQKSIGTIIRMLFYFNALRRGGGRIVIKDGSSFFLWTLSRALCPELLSIM